MTTVHTPIGAGNPAPALARVPFRGGFILAAAGPVDQEGARPVPLRPFCEALRLDPDTQARKLKGKPWACPVIMTVQVPGDVQAREMLCIPLRALPMWLATIHPAKVAPEARPMLEAYQAEACDVLYRHFLATPSTAAVDVGAQLAALATRVAWLEANQGRRPRPQLAARPITEALMQQAWAVIRRKGWRRVTPRDVSRGIKALRRCDDAAAALDALSTRGLVAPTAAHHGRAYLVVTIEAAASGVVNLWPARPRAAQPRPPAAPAPRPRRGGEPGPAAPRQSPCAPSTRRPPRRSPATTSPPCSLAW